MVNNGYDDGFHDVELYSGWWLSYPSEKYEWKSVGMMKFPIYGKIKKMFLTTKQLWFQWLEIGSLLVVNWWWLFVDVDGLEVYWVESQANKLKVKQKK